MSGRLSPWWQTVGWAEPPLFPVRPNSSGPSRLIRCAASSSNGANRKWNWRVSYFPNSRMSYPVLALGLNWSGNEDWQDSPLVSMFLRAIINWSFLSRGISRWQISNKWFEQIEVPFSVLGDKTICDCKPASKSAFVWGSDDLMSLEGEDFMEWGDWGIEWGDGIGFWEKPNFWRAS